MIRAVITALVSHWRRHLLQLATLLAGLALATGLWSAVQAINTEARASYHAAAAQLGGAALPELHATNGPITVAQYVALRRAGWQVSPVLEGRMRLGNTWVRVMGIDPLSHPGLPALDMTDANVSPSQVFNTLYARQETIERIGAAPQDLHFTQSDLVPSGVVLGDISQVSRLLDQPDTLSRLLILPRQPLGLRPLAQIVPDLHRLVPERAADASRLTDSFHLNLTAFGLLSFAVGLFIVHGTIGLVFEQRRSMIRTLRALGVPLGLLSLMLVGELILLALIGGISGLVLGYIVASALIPDVAATLRGLYGASVEGSLTLRPLWVLSGLGMAILGTLAASAQALWRIYRMPLLAGPGVMAWASRSSKSLQRQAAFGLCLMLGGGAVVLIFDGLIAGFTLLAGMMLGAALILPFGLDAILRLAQKRARGAVAIWVWSDMRASLPGLSLALMALLLALATNIGVGTMVSSFRATFTGWLDQRLAAQIYVSAADDAQAVALHGWLESRVDAVLPIRFGEIQHDGQSLRVYGVPDHATYRDHWPLIQTSPLVWDEIAAGQGALVNEVLARRAGLWTGSKITLGKDWTLPVLGVYSDYGNPAGQVIVSIDMLLTNIDHVPDRQFGLRLDPKDTKALIRDLSLEFDTPPLAGLLDQSDIKAQSIAIFDKTFLVTGALNILTLGVAGFAILTSLLTLWSMRLPQVAPVWALGLTRARLAQLEILRSLALAGLTALFALPLGLALAWTLLAVINVEAFGWRLPMFLFPMDWVRLFGLTMLAAFIAAALPARRLLKLPPADLLRVFANAR